MDTLRMILLKLRSNFLQKTEITILFSDFISSYLNKIMLSQNIENMRGTSENYSY